AVSDVDGAKLARIVGIRRARHEHRTEVVRLNLRVFVGARRGAYLAAVETNRERRGIESDDAPHTIRVALREKREERGAADFERLRAISWNQHRRDGATGNAANALAVVDDAENATLRRRRCAVVRDAVDAFEENDARGLRIDERDAVFRAHRA